jgi:cytoskeletal protein CcmA (bactofilin family)
MFRWSRPAPDVAPPGPAPTAPTNPASPGRRFTDAAPERPTSFGPGIQVRGTLSGSDSVVVAGRFEGSLELDGLCHIAEGACVIGPVTATDAVVEGELQGRLTVRGRVELHASARVRGDIEARTVALADGCFFDGRIHMTGRDAPGAPTTFREKRKKRGRADATAAPDAAATPAVEAPPAPETRPAADAPPAAPGAKSTPLTPQGS